jgi:putative NIF3 family GTP cyclohydrolase 1 type 2
MKIKDIMNIAIQEGIAADPRPSEEINQILKEQKEKYGKLEGVEKDIFDSELLENPYADSRILWDNGIDADELWVGIDIDTSELLLVKGMTEKTGKNPAVISHHPLGRSYVNFYEVMDMQADILQKQGITSSIADNLTRSRKSEVARKVSGVNHFKGQDAARILDIALMNIHTPADNHVAMFLDEMVKNESPGKLKELLDMLLSIPEYKHAAVGGNAPVILNGDKNNKCGKVFIDMTGGTEGNAELLRKLVDSGVSTVVGMHMSENHYKIASEVNLNVIIAGHISSDNVGLNLMLDKIIKKLGNVAIVEFSGFKRVNRS